MPSSLFWSVGSLALASIISPSIATGHQTYHLLNSWEGEEILDHFTFHEGGDPTNGYVTYVNQSYAMDAGLVKITSKGSLYMGVDYDSVLDPAGPGRDSVRIESKKYFNEGLYILDIQHMPGSICGTWPAFWTVGPNWPYDGEIDIIEGVNMHDSNKIVLHTSGSCDVAGENDMSGKLTSGECGDASGTIGCVVEGEKGSSGTPFNLQGGGLYAMERRPTYLKIWFFPRASIPKSITEGSPDTSTFGTPMAHLEGTCNFHERFTAQKFILNTVFCGDWAGNVFGDSGCPMSDSSSPMNSCVDFVAKNPALFKQAYWEINSFQMFEIGAAPAPETTTKPKPEVHSTMTEEATTHQQPKPTEAEETTPRPEPTSTTTTADPETTSTTTQAATVPEPTSATHPHASIPSAVEPEEPEEPEVTRITSYVTLTTTLCPLSKPTTDSLPTAYVTESTPIAPAPPAPTESVTEEAPPATVDTIPCDTSSAPTTSSDVTPTPSSEWIIVPSSSQFVSVPTGASPSSPVESPDSPSIVETQPSATVPSTPIFTGGGSRLSIGIPGILWGMVLAMLA